ncbi:flavin reductase family protein [Sphingomonas fuzhouensis]|uniref:flavin reductase family protein n=1 Tax=Sphingomonas fuzhouensis TaxID=3106033 RepID=UPI002AFE673F|nr:flavin reductase family protein [Sphingomonas sp. SGZ-02]
MTVLDEFAIDPTTFRKVLGCYPTGVAVITSINNDERFGFVVGSFTSISLDPPLVGFFPGKSSSSWPKIAESGRFCVNVLGADQVEICRHFAGKSADKFVDIAHRSSVSGMPLIDGAVAWVECRITEIKEIGDHYLVIGAVERMSRSEEERPLVFLNGSYHGCVALV